jgi:hypothetical protein
MNEIVPFHGTAVVTGGRPNIRALIKHYLAPYSAAEPFRDLIKAVRKNSTAAGAIRKAAAGRIQAVTDARDRMSVATLAPDEEDVRAVIAAMLMTFPTPPTETSSFFIDALVLELREPDDGEAYRCRRSPAPPGRCGAPSPSRPRSRRS